MKPVESILASNLTKDAENPPQTIQNIHPDTHILNATLDSLFEQNNPHFPPENLIKKEDFKAHLERLAAYLKQENCYKNHVNLMLLDSKAVFKHLNIEFSEGSLTDKLIIKLTNRNKSEKSYQKVLNICNIILKKSFDHKMLGHPTQKAHLDLLLFAFEIKEIANLYGIYDFELSGNITGVIKYCSNIQFDSLLEPKELLQQVKEKIIHFNPELKLKIFFHLDKVYKNLKNFYTDREIFEELGIKDASFIKTNWSLIEAADDIIKIAYSSMEKTIEFIKRLNELKARPPTPDNILLVEKLVQEFENYFSFEHYLYLRLLVSKKDLKTYFLKYYPSIGQLIKDHDQIEYSNQKNNVNFVVNFQKEILQNHQVDISELVKTLKNSLPLKSDLSKPKVLGQMGGYTYRLLGWAFGKKNTFATTLMFTNQICPSTSKV